MTRLCRFLMLTLLVLGFVLPSYGKAEAAKVAVLPLVMEEQDAAARRAWVEACTKQFKFPEFTMIDDTVMDNAAKEANYATLAQNGPDEALIRKIMAKTGADIGVMMVIDELSMNPIRPNGYEDMYAINQKTRIMLVNNITGTVNKHRVNDSEEVEYAVIVRSDYLHDQFRNTCIRELKKVNKVK